MNSTIQTDELSQRTIIASFTNGRGATFSLVQRESGLQVAGSGHIAVKAAYGVLYVLRDDLKGGRWFNTYLEAEKVYEEAKESSRQYEAAMKKAGLIK